MPPSGERGGVRESRESQRGGGGVRRVNESLLRRSVPVNKTRAGSGGRQGVIPYTFISVEYNDKFDSNPP